MARNPAGNYETGRFNLLFMRSTVSGSGDFELKILFQYLNDPRSFFFSQVTNILDLVVAKNKCFLRALTVQSPIYGGFDSCS